MKSLKYQNVLKIFVASCFESIQISDNHVLAFHKIFVLHNCRHIRVLNDHVFMIIKLIGYKCQFKSAKLLNLLVQ